MEPADQIGVIAVPLMTGDTDMVKGGHVSSRCKGRALGFSDGLNLG